VHRDRTAQAWVRQKLAADGDVLWRHTTGSLWLSRLIALLTFLQAAALLLHSDFCTFMMTLLTLTGALGGMVWALAERGPLLTLTLLTLTGALGGMVWAPAEGSHNAGSCAVASAAAYAADAGQHPQRPSRRSPIHVSMGARPLQCATVREVRGPLPACLPIHVPMGAPPLQCAAVREARGSLSARLSTWLSAHLFVAPPDCLFVRRAHMSIIASASTRIAHVCPALHASIRCPFPLRGGICPSVKTRAHSGASPVHSQDDCTRPHHPKEALSVPHCGSLGPKNY
jgi:hypothetical protein